MIHRVLFGSIERFFGVLTEYYAAKDVEAGAVSFRFRDGSQINGVPVDEAVTTITDWITQRVNSSPTANDVKAQDDARTSC